MRSLTDISGSVRGGTAPILFLRQLEDAYATLGQISFVSDFRNTPFRVEMEIISEV